MRNLAKCVSGRPKVANKAKTRYSGRVFARLSRNATQQVQTKALATYKKEKASERALVIRLVLVAISTSTGSGELGVMNYSPCI